MLEYESPEETKHRRRRKHKRQPDEGPSTRPPPKRPEVRTFRISKIQLFVQLIAMPLSWVEAKLVMTVWLTITFLIFLLSIVTLPLGCLLAAVASFMYFSRKGTVEAYAGKYSARVISSMAFAAWIYDMLIFTMLMVGSVVLVFSLCTDLDNTVCNFRKSLGYYVAAQTCMVFFHAVASFAAFIAMRDCYKDICLDEHEERDRFADLEKQVLEDFRKKVEEEEKSKRKKKKKSHEHKKKESKHKHHHTHHK